MTSCDDLRIVMFSQILNVCVSLDLLACICHGQPAHGLAGCLLALVSFSYAKSTQTRLEQWGLWQVLRLTIEKMISAALQYSISNSALAVQAFLFAPEFISMYL